MTRRFAMSSTNVNRKANVPTKLETSLQNALTGVQKVLGAMPAGTKFTVAKVAYDATGLASQLQGFVTPLTNARAAKVAWAQGSQAAKAAAPGGKQLLKALKATLVGLYGASDTELGQFGFTPAKVPTPLTGEQQVVKTTKMLATRKARSTMGSKQKAGITGTVPAQVTVSTGGAATLSPTPAQPATTK
jgi:hypothetical protein